MCPCYGYWGQNLHIDLATNTWRVETHDEKWYRLYAGGGLMGTYFMLKETQAGIDPFAPENLLIFLSSVLAGLDAPGLARFSSLPSHPSPAGLPNRAAKVVSAAVFKPAVTMPSYSTAKRLNRSILCWTALR